MGDTSSKVCMVDAILFDFGGVLAEEGFRDGLFSIARSNGLEPESFARTGFELVYDTGYVLGRADERTFWQALREKTGIAGTDKSFREEILYHFRLRPRMMDLVKKLRESGLRLAILSDQTDWLDELDARYDFYRGFDHVFNSYHMGKSKKEAAVFDDVLELMGVEADLTLFVDDHLSHIKRAEERGIQTIWFADEETFLAGLRRFCPDLTQ